MIYFAFGSNMDPEQIKERCPSQKELGRAYLSDYQLCFPRRSKSRKCGTAGIAPAKGKGVWGALYELNHKDTENLHKKEGYAPGRPAAKNSHDLVQIEVRRDRHDGQIVSAFTYRARPDGSEVAPSSGFMKHLIRGAEHHALPGSYIEMLRSVETG